MKYIITYSIILTLIIIRLSIKDNSNTFKTIELPEEFNLRDSSDKFTYTIINDTLLIQFKHI